jgi:hypothetical protein
MSIEKTQPHATWPESSDISISKYRRSQSLKTAFGDTITDLWATTTSLDPAEPDNFCFRVRAVWQSVYP